MTRCRAQASVQASDALVSKNNGEQGGENRWSLVLPPPPPPDFGTAWRGIVDSSGNTQSISTFFKMIVPHSGQVVALGPIFTPRNINDDELELELELEIIDADHEVVVCCRIFTTSNGVTTAKQCYGDGPDGSRRVVEEGASMMTTTHRQHRRRRRRHRRRRGRSWMMTTTLM
jgi:hypothetical protein